MLTNLANFGSQFIGLDANLTPPTSGSAGGGEYLAASVTGMTGGLGSSLNSRQIITGIAKGGGSLAEWDRDFITKKGTVDPPEWRSRFHSKVIYEPADKAKVARYGRKVGDIELVKSNTGASVNILPWTASVVGYLELLTGFGPPNEGDDLKVSAEQWSALQEYLEAALPNEDWQGEASGAYAAQVVALRDIAQTLADLDGQLADLVENQAEWVTHIRLGFGILLNLLTVAIAIEAALRIALVAVPGGPAWAMGWAILASSLAMAAALGMLGALTGLSVENGKKADDVTSEIDRLGAAAAQFGIESTTHSEVSAAPESRVSEFQRLSNAPSATIAAPSRQQSAQRKMAEKQSERRQTGTTEAPESPQDAQRDDKQNAAMPTLGTLMQMSNQAGNNSAQSSRRADPLNSLIGRGRQPDPMADQDPAAEAVQAQGAGAGSDAADRAPIEVGGETEQTLQRELGK
ncbi:hypothetical protein AWC17_20035 [Mycobacterium nebraskense]|uniref:ESX-1 secretion-associated protein EspA/EspE-like domain-containing protein n=2 Tax=Mycobacterium nebraskense TaxID=244292 RepID=A0A0F5ND50_9MYCO|nr:hypothetical protein WU83_11900 [Mycobacterium nebraskense]KLO41647.1 hypothetical protein ABW17_13905 [Mycobacterium nebraskense]ORW14326.1 hypothetical protein AWC17_20035 [Mycobacterium nebraskense]